MSTVLTNMKAFKRTITEKRLFEIDVNGEKKECMAYLMNGGHISPPMSYYYNVIKQRNAVKKYGVMRRTVWTQAI